jgi:hypothetical protein
LRSQIQAKTFGFYSNKEKEKKAERRLLDAGPMIDAAHLLYCIYVIRIRKKPKKDGVYVEGHQPTLSIP